MPTAPRAPLQPLNWLLAGALLLSVGANLYLLTPRDRAERTEALAGAARPFQDDDNAEDDDASWTALTEELRQTRHQLSECQAQHLPAEKGPSQR